MKTEIEPFQIAALVLAGQSPIRETVELHGGAVVIRTVARHETFLCPRCGVEISIFENLGRCRNTAACNRRIQKSAKQTQ